MVTRARAQADLLAEKIRAFGGIPISIPAIAFAPLEEFTALDAALTRVDSFDWVVFTSVNGVRFADERLAALGLHAHALNGLCVAAIGPATARALTELGVRVDFVPSKFLGERVAHELPAGRGERVLLLRANLASDDLARALDARGVSVCDVDVYRTLPAPPSSIDLQGADAVTFASASSVQNFLLLMDAANGARLNLLDIFCIGPVTANTARELGLNVTATAREYTMDVLIAVMCEYYDSFRGESTAEAAEGAEKN